MKIGFKTKVRFYTFLLLLLSSVLTTVYLSVIKVNDSTTLDHHFSKNAELIVDRLRFTDWGKSKRGKRILSDFHADEIRIIVPRPFSVGDHIYYSFSKDDLLHSSASGLMLKDKGSFTIHISVYHISEIKKEKRLLRYMDYAIPEDEFVHILVDELLSRHLEGKYFVDGQASWQEELDAWNAAEEAVKAYYDDPNYKVRGMSYEIPNYGPDSSSYSNVR